MSVDERLKEIGITLPEAPKPLGAYLPCVQTGSLVFLSGNLPLKDGKLLYAGKLGDTVSLEEAQTACRQTVINALSVLRSHIGDLDRITRCVKLNGFIASSDVFTDQPKVLNAASDLLFEIFGEKGRHARAAIGVNVLPLNSPVEIDFIFEVTE